MAVPGKPLAAAPRAPEGKAGQPPAAKPRRRAKFEAALAGEPVDKRALAELAWQGVPQGASRWEVWQLLLGYRPLAAGRQQEALQKKRAEYGELRRSLYDGSETVVAWPEGLPPDPDGDGALLRQIRKDLPRTRLRPGALGVAVGPVEMVVKQPRVQGLMERILFVWAVRQPASGYVQGLNEVLLPLIVVSFLDRGGSVDASDLDEDSLGELEADCYWCLTKILSEIFDHYTHGQPGIQRMVHRLDEIIRRIDLPLAQHLEGQGTDLFTTAFRWITCLMVRELPMPCCVRLWDTLIAESALEGGRRNGDSCGGSAGFEALLVYFCACFTAYFSARLRTLDFEAITFFLQQMPTENFGEAEVEVLLGEAYVLKSLFQEAPRHLSVSDAPAAAH